jgi:hypothetical protein
MLVEIHNTYSSLETGLKLKKNTSQVMQMTSIEVPTAPGLSEAQKAFNFVSSFARIQDPVCP